MSVKKVTTFRVHDERTAPRCSNCGEILDAATGFNDTLPNPGDAAICLSCGVLHKFDEDLWLVPFTEKDWEERTEEERAALTAAHELARKMNEEKNRRG